MIIGDDSAVVRSHMKKASRENGMRKIEIAVLEKYQTFGHECIFFDLPTPFEAISMSSETEMY